MPEKKKPHPVDQFSHYAVPSSILFVVFAVGVDPVDGVVESFGPGDLVQQVDAEAAIATWGRAVHHHIWGFLQGTVKMTHQ